MSSKRSGFSRRAAITLIGGTVAATLTSFSALAALAWAPPRQRFLLQRHLVAAPKIRATSAEDYVRQFVLQNFSGLPKMLGDEVVNAYCRAVVTCCEPLQIVEWKDMGWYAYMGLILGLNFYRDPQWHDVPSIISDLNTAPAIRIEKAYQLMRTNIYRVAGEDFSYLKKAFLLLVFYQITDETAELAEDDDACLGELDKLWPQKAELIRSVRESYYAAAREEARNAGFTGDLDGALFGFIGAFAGLGFYGDPICSWVKDIIDAHRNDTSKQRFVLSLQEIQRYGVKKQLFG